MFSNLYTELALLPCATALAAGFGLGIFFSRLMAGNSEKRCTTGENVASEEATSSFGNSELKFVMVVQNGLKMGKGKIGAQCGHASVLCYKLLAARKPKLLKKWEQGGNPKIVLKVEDEESLLEIAKAAESAGLIVGMIRDAGHTQVPALSKTVVGIGPGPSEVIDRITGHLKLL